MGATARWTAESALARGRAADRLLDDNSDVLTPELEDGFGAQLKSDLAFLSVDDDEKALGDQRTATATEREIATDAHDLLMLIREAVRRSPKGTPRLRAAVGVGHTLNATDTRGILDALGAVATHADGLRTCRIPASAIGEAADLATALQSADSGQSDAIQGRASSTDSRLEAQLRLEGAIDTIHMAGLFAFRKDPAKRARFEALVSSSGPASGGPSSGPTS